jgi:hypothetical protein
LITIHCTSFRVGSLLNTLREGLHDPEEPLRRMTAAKQAIIDRLLRKRPDDSGVCDHVPCQSAVSSSHEQSVERSDENDTAVDQLMEEEEASEGQYDSEQEQVVAPWKEIMLMQSAPADMEEEEGTYSDEEIISRE